MRDAKMAELLDSAAEALEDALACWDLEPEERNRLRSGYLLEASMMRTTAVHLRGEYEVEPW